MNKEVIKEVRKLIKKYGLVDETGNFNAYLDTIELKEVLQILDKGESNE